MGEKDITSSTAIFFIYMLLMNRAKRIFVEVPGCHSEIGGKNVYGCLFQAIKITG